MVMRKVFEINRRMERYYTMSSFIFFTLHKMKENGLDVSCGTHGRWEMSTKFWSGKQKEYTTWKTLP